MSGWMTDDRATWNANSLRHRASELRSAERKCRNMFKKEYMGEPANWLADVYSRAAQVMEDALAEIAKGDAK
jgi:hypothetical protein